MTDTTMAEYEENVDTPRPGESGLRNRDRRRLRSKCLLRKNSKSWFWEGCQHFFSQSQLWNSKDDGWCQAVFWQKLQGLLLRAQSKANFQIQMKILMMRSNIFHIICYLGRLPGTLHSSWQIFSKRKHKSNFGEGKEILSFCEVIATSNSFSWSTKKSSVKSISNRVQSLF